LRDFVSEEDKSKKKFGGDAEGFEKWKTDRDAKKQQSFGSATFGWIPGLGNVDWSKPMFGSGKDRGQATIPKPIQSTPQIYPLGDKGGGTSSELAGIQAMLGLTD
jgi:hypothetical protein